MSTARKGRAGEEIAARYLISKGFSILERNYAIRGGEIDIIAAKDGELDFIEVKAWDGFGEEDLGVSIGPRKRQRILKTARWYLSQRETPEKVRFHVVFVTDHGSKIRLYTDAIEEARG